VGVNRESGFIKNIQPCSKEEIKQKVQSGEIKLVFGTDSASEGLNLATVRFSLVNIDLPMESHAA